MAAREKWIISVRGQEIIRQTTSLDSTHIISQDLELGGRVAYSLIPQSIQVTDLDQAYIRVHSAVVE